MTEALPPTPETITPACETLRTTRAQLLALQNELNRADQAPNASSVTINGHILIPYAALNDLVTGLTPRQYFDYVVSIIETPDDVFQVVNTENKIVEWKNSDKDTNNILLPAETILAAGGYDCDNLAWIAKVLLDKLGCKQGVDYHAMSIGSATAGHAVCVYRNEADKLCSINQTEHRKDIPNIASAATFFTADLSDWQEMFLHKNNKTQIRISRPINPNNLNPNYSGRLMADVYTSYTSETFNAATVLPPEWERYEVTQITFQHSFILFYKKGVFYQRENISTQTIEHFDENGHLIEIKFNDTTCPVAAEFYRENGTLEQKEFKDGVLEAYSETGKLQQKHYPESSPIKEEYYYEDGITIRQRNFRAQEATQETGGYEVEFYDQTGKLIAANPWGGGPQIHFP